jgi:LmbE family N-acetylglucosaminyl deacetylase
LHRRFDMLRRVGEWQPRLVPISEQIGVKIAAITRYRSQLGVLFGSSEAMPKVVRAYSQAVGAWGGVLMRRGSGMRRPFILCGEGGT